MRLSFLGCVIVSLLLTACSQTGSLRQDGDALFAPGIDPRGRSVSGLEVGHRLMDARQPELALDAFTRAAGEEGLTADVLVGLGSANLALGRLNQSERQLRRAVEVEPTWPAAWNNLGVLLMERGQTAEAAEVFRRAFALDNGQSAAVRNNLLLALEKLDSSAYAVATQQEFRLVRRGSGSYAIRRNL